MNEMTAEMAVDIAVPDDLHLSPDGQHVAYVLAPYCKREEHASSALWIGRIGDNTEAYAFTQTDTENIAPRWSPDGKHIAFLSDRAQRGSLQLYTIAFSGGEAQALTTPELTKSIHSFAWSPQGGQIAFTSSDEPTEEDKKREKDHDDALTYGENWPYDRLRLISLVNKEVTTLVGGQRHITEIAWHPEGKEIAYVVRQTPDLESLAQEVVIERVALAGGEPREICRFPVAVASLFWAADGETLYFIASVAQKSQSSQALYVVAAQGGEPRRFWGGETTCVIDARPLQQNPHVAIMIADGLRSRLCLVHPQDEETVTLLETPDGTGYESWDVCRLHDDSVAIVVGQSAADQPSQVWAGKTTLTPEQLQSLHLQQITTHNEHLRGISFGKQEPFYWQARDGQKLDGLLIRPPGAQQGQPLPMVVLVHGGPYARWEDGFHQKSYDWGQWLAVAGYVVLMPNPRGGSGHGEQFAAVARGAVGETDYQDVIDAVDAAIERKIADPEHVGVGGWSQGGFMSAWAVTQTTRFKAAIMGAGVSDWGMMSMSSDLPDFECELGGSAPWDGEAYRKHLDLSPITFVHNVRTPVLILHGEKDARVPLTQAIGFHRALRRQGVPVVFVTYPREQHDIFERMHQIDMLHRVRSWYDLWLH